MEFLELFEFVADILQDLLHQTEQEIAASKEAYDQAVKQREHTEKQIKVCPYTIT